MHWHPVRHSVGSQCTCLNVKQYVNLSMKTARDCLSAMSIGPSLLSKTRPRSRVRCHPRAAPCTGQSYPRAYRFTRGVSSM